VLTENDYNNIVQLISIMDFVNTLSDEEITKMSNDISWDDIKQTLTVEERKLLEDVEPNDKVVTTINTHNGIKIKSITKFEEPTDGDKNNN
jgi:hypothetical protein